MVSHGGLYRDLIDTQWNVNYEKAYHMAEKERDLIDTQWNVNEAIDASALEDYSI